MKVKPLGSRVLLKIEEQKLKTAGGLYIPESAQEKTNFATVEAVGEISEKIKIELKVGDKVMYEKYGGTQIKIGDKDFLVIDIKDVIAIIE